MTFSETIEQWATLYAPMQHDASEASKNKRFFQILSYKSMFDFSKSLPSNQSPCIAYELLTEGTIAKGKTFITHNLYVLVKAKNINSVVSHVEAIAEAQLHVDKLMAWIEVNRRNYESLAHVQTQEVEFYTMPPFQNGWFGCGIAIGDILKQHCFNPQDYI